MAAGAPRVGRLEIRLLGPPEVRIDGRTIKFRTEGELKAVCVLAATGPGGLHTAQLADILWPDSEPGDVSHRMDVLLSGVRQSLLPTTRLTRRRGAARRRRRRV